MLSRLYEQYGVELAALHEPARNLCSTLRAADWTFCSTDDVEAEITYMRVREAKPKHILELAPRAGYSTFFLLAAVRANGAGLVHSYDLEDLIQRKALLTALGEDSEQLLGRVHRMEVGDARDVFPLAMAANAPVHGRGERSDGPFFDYIFLDADHSAAFGQWLGQAILTRQAALQVHSTRRTPVSIHDAFHNYLPSSEAVSALLELPPSATANVKRTLFSAAKCRIGRHNWQQLLKVRARACAACTSSLPMHGSATNNPSIFFEI